jgi:hypothetical protein
MDGTNKVEDIGEAFAVYCCGWRAGQEKSDTHQGTGRLAT